MALPLPTTNLYVVDAGSVKVYGIVPAPGAALLASFGLFGLLAQRRRFLEWRGYSPPF